MEKQVEGAEDCNCSPGVYAGQLELRAGGIHLLAGEGKDRALLGYLVDAAWSALKGKINCSSLLFEKILFSSQIVARLRQICGGISSL